MFYDGRLSVVSKLSGIKGPCEFKLIKKKIKKNQVKSMQRSWTGLKPSATARVSVSLPFSIVNSLLSRTAPCCMFYKSAYKDRSVANRNFFKKKSIFSSKPSRRKVLNKLPANEADSSHQSPTTWAFLCDFFFLCPIGSLSITLLLMC